MDQRLIERALSGRQGQFGSSVGRLIGLAMPALYHRA
jgi:hypothetical protein